MNMNRYLEDDDLILYAMQALSQPEATSVAASLGQSEELRQRYADIRITLGLYAGAVVQPVEAPKGSLERLMTSIAAGENVVKMPPVALRPESPRRSQASKGTALWAGWAIAALLLITAGLQFRQIRQLQRTVSGNLSQLQQARDVHASLSRERDAVQNEAQQKVSQANASVAELSSRSATLSEKADAAASLAEQESRRAAQLSARVNAEASRALRESSRAADLASVAAANASERDQLRGTLTQQQNQLAQLGAQAVEARQVLDALSDPVALRATLTVPKQKKTPSGRGTYVPNRGTLLFVGSNLPALQGNRVYELWLMPTDGSSPIPAGTFTPDASGNATLVSTTFRKSIAAKGFAVTAEPTGGSQTPTLPILLVAL